MGAGFTTVGFKPTLLHLVYYLYLHKSKQKIIYIYYTSTPACVEWCYKKYAYSTNNLLCIYASISSLMHVVHPYNTTEFIPAARSAAF